MVIISALTAKYSIFLRFGTSGWVQIIKHLFSPRSIRENLKQQSCEIKTATFHSEKNRLKQKGWVTLIVEMIHMKQWTFSNVTHLICLQNKKL